MYMYSDEAGLLVPNRKQTPYFGLCGLCISDSVIDSAKQVIKDLRKKHNYWVNFEYKTNNKHKMGLCKDLIDWYFTEEGIGFCAFVLRVADIDWSYFRKGTELPHNACYTYLYRKMLDNFLRDHVVPGEEINVVIDKQSLSQQELRNRFSYFLSHRSIKSCIDVHSYNDDLLQFTDLLISSTVNRFTLFEHPLFTKSPVKNGISEHLMNKLGLNDFWNWRLVGETWGPTDITWIKDNRNPHWEKPFIKGTKKWGRKFDLFSFHGY